MRYEKEDKRGNVNVSSVEVGCTGYNRILSLIITQRILMNKKYADQENSYAFYPQISTVPQNRRLRRVPQPPSPPDLPSPPLAPRRRRFSLRFWQIPVLDGTEELGSVVPIHLGEPFPDRANVPASRRTARLPAFPEFPPQAPKVGVNAPSWALDAEFLAWAASAPSAPPLLAATVTNLSAP